MAGACRDESLIRHVDTPNPAYVFQEKGAILSWQEINEPEGFLSLNDAIGDIMDTPEGKELLEKDVLPKIPEREGPLGKRDEDDKKAAEKMRRTFTLMRLIRLSRAPFTKEELLDVNARLNRIPKPKED